MAKNILTTAQTYRIGTVLEDENLTQYHVIITSAGFLDVINIQTGHPLPIVKAILLSEPINPLISGQTLSQLMGGKFLTFKELRNPIFRKARV